MLRRHGPMAAAQRCNACPTGPAVRILAAIIGALTLLTPDSVLGQNDTLGGNNNDTLLIGFLPAVKNNQGETKYILGAFSYALEEINNDEYLLPGINLTYNMTDIEGNSMKSIQSMISYMCDIKVDAFIGPEDTCRTEALIASAKELPMITYKCRETEANHEDSDSEEKYTTFARTLPSTSKVSKSIIAMMKKHSWTSCSIVCEETDTWLQTARRLQREAEIHNIVINNEKKILKFPRLPLPKGNMKQLIKDSFENTRIYVFLGDLNAMQMFIRGIQCAVEDGTIKKRGEHVVIAVNEEPYDPKNNYFWDKAIEKGNGCTTNSTCLTDNQNDTCREPLEAHTVGGFESVTVLMILPRRPEDSARYKHFIDETRERSTNEFGVPEVSSDLLDIIGVDWTGMPVPIFAAYLYDAVRLYAIAVNQTMAAGEDYRNGSVVISRIRGTTYRSIQGFDVRISDDGDAEANYTVVALKELKKDELHEYYNWKGKALIPVAEFVQRDDEDDKDNETSSAKYSLPEFRVKEGMSIDWAGGGQPISEPECGFKGEKCRVETDWMTPVICVAVASALLIVAIFALRHYLYEQKLASLLWKIEYKDLLMTSPENDPTWSEKTKRKGYGRLSFLGHTETPEDLKSGKNCSIRLASYKGAIVAVKMLKKRHVEVTRSLRKELHVMKELSHDNINRFVGACVEAPNVCTVTQFCSRGSLKDILENEDLRLDDMFIASLVMDLIKGMIYLHDTEIGSHGNLKSSNCLVDSRWVLEISDFGLQQLKAQDLPAIVDENAYYERFLYKAPEILREPDAPPQGTPKGDVYSFALILYEMHIRVGPWGYCKLPPRDIVDNVREVPGDSPPFRPDTRGLGCEDFVVRCMQECWVEEPELRPDFKYTKLRLKPMQKGFRSNIFDQMLSIMEKYANNLEALVDDRTLQLVEEKKKTEALLLRMLPSSIAEQLKMGLEVEPEQYQCVTIYFSDIVGFTALSAESTPMEVVSLLNDLYTLFDSVIEEYDVYKVETIGDAYMVVSGLPIRNGYNHAGEIASMSLHLLRAIKHFRIRHMPEETLKLRIGMHSGPCVAGVVGSKMPRYCLFGDTVNTASRMESTGVPLKIHCSPSCRAILDTLGGYHLEDRGPVNMKGKGEMYTYFIQGEDKSHRLRRISSVVGQLVVNHTPNSANKAKVAAAIAPRNGGVCIRNNISLSDSDSDSEPDAAVDHVDEEEETSPKANLLNGAAHFIVDLDTRESAL